MERLDGTDDKTIDELMPPEERKKFIKTKLFESCKKGDAQGLLKVINDEMLNLDDLDEKKWTPLQWAVVNGHSEVVKILCEKHDAIKTKNILVVEQEATKKVEEVKDYKKNEFDDIFKKPPNSSFLGKYNPLHWAAYKGYSQIASLLIKFDYDPLEIDNVGNTSIHQAAASNNVDVFKIFMGLGLDLEIKNDRGHTPSDLTANKTIKNLIHKSMSVKSCQLCPKTFDFFNKRYFCATNEEVICKNCCVSEFYYENVNSKDKDIMECRCKNCYSLVQEVEANIKNALKSNDLNQITKSFNEINEMKQKGIKICCKLAIDIEININRLEREKKIFEHLNSLKQVENHKTIEKSVFLLEEMIKNAKESNIELDTQVIEKCNNEKSRLLSEKELRKVLANLTVDLSSYDNLKNLDEKIQTSINSGVEEKYTQEGEELKRKIQLNLTAKELLELLCEYPIREYPEVVVVDPKKKTPPPKPDPKAKKKKAVPFIVPEWAKELKTIIDKSQELKGYTTQSNEIGLDDTFVSRSKEQLVRFGKEIAFRKEEDETLRKLEEEKKKKKGGGGKK